MCCLTLVLTLSNNGLVISAVSKFFFSLSLFSAVTLFFLIIIPCITLSFSPSSLVYYTFQKHVWGVEHFNALPRRLLLVSYFSSDETESQKGNWIIKKPLTEPPVPGSLSHALLSVGPCFLLQLLISVRYTDWLNSLGFTDNTAGPICCLQEFLWRLVGFVSAFLGEKATSSCQYRGGILAKSQEDESWSGLCFTLSSISRPKFLHDNVDWHSVILLFCILQRCLEVPSESHGSASPRTPGRSAAPSNRPSSVLKKCVHGHGECNLLLQDQSMTWYIRCVVATMLPCGLPLLEAGMTSLV